MSKEWLLLLGWLGFMGIVGWMGAVSNKLEQIKRLLEKDKR